MAVCYRAVLPALCIFVPLIIGKGATRETVMYLGISMLLLAAYSVIGALCRWKHIYCALQRLVHKKMTPDDIRWDSFGFSDKYGAPIVLIIFSAICFACYFLGW